MASRWNYLDWEEIKSAYPEYASYGPKPSLDSIVVEFLKQYEVYVKPASTAETPGGRDRASSAFFGAVSGATGNFDIAADAAIISNQRKGAAIQEWTQWKQWALDHSAFEAFRTRRLEDWEKLRARVESDEFAAEWEAQKGQRKIQEQEARLEMAWLEKGLIAFLALTFAALFSWMMVEKIQDLRSMPDIRGTSTK